MTPNRNKKPSNSGKLARNSVVMNGSHEIPGLRFSSDGAVGFSTDNLPASTHFFDATHYVVDSSGEHFVMLFGQKSTFSKEERYNLAVEISMPRYYAQTFLSKAIFDTPSITEQRPFIESLNDSFNSLEVKDTKEINKLMELPTDINSFRRFSANFATFSLSGGQGLIEFYEVPPDLLVSVVHSRSFRKGAGAHSVLSILTNVSLMKCFLDEVRQTLK